MLTNDEIIRTVADELPVGVWVARAPDGAFVYANQAFAEIMGTGPRAEVVAGGYAEPYGICDRQGAPYSEERMPFVRALRERQTVLVDDIVIHRTDGRRVNIQAQARPVFDGVGNITHVVIGFIDITRQVEAERHRDDFLSIASHELRTPVASVVLAVQSLLLLHKRGGLVTAPPQMIARALEVADRQLRRLGGLLDSLLDAARMARGSLAIERAPMRLDELVREVVELFADRAAAVGSEMSLVVEGVVEGSWDRARIEQVLCNLLDNALKYGEGRPVRIEVSGGAGGAQVVVSDQGIGIDPARTQRIFDRFERAVSSRQFGGLGLGLFIVRQVVEAHGGTATVEAAPSQGATFTITLPRRPSSP